MRQECGDAPERCDCRGGQSAERSANRRSNRDRHGGCSDDSGLGEDLQIVVIAVLPDVPVVRRRQGGREGAESATEQRTFQPYAERVVPDGDADIVAPAFESRVLTEPPAQLVRQEEE